MQEMQEKWVQSLGQENPLEKEMTLVFFPEKCYGARSLVGYSPQGCKDMAEHACMLSFFTSCYMFF